MTVGERMRKIRLEKGLTQREVSARCHIAEPTIRKYESGRLNPKFETMDKIASALEVPVTALMGYVFTGNVNGKDTCEVPHDTIDIDLSKEKPTPEDGGGLVERAIRLDTWFHSLPPETRKAILTLGGGPEDLAE